jgi:uncharacterized protein YabE (DUF348 family)
VWQWAQPGLRVAADVAVRVWQWARPGLRTAVKACGRVARHRASAAVAMAALVVTVLTVLTLNMRVVTISEHGINRVVVTFGDDAHTALGNAGVALDGGDKVDVTLDANNKLESVVVDRAFNVYVTADGKTTLVRMTGGTVQDALDRVGVTPEEADEIEPAPNASLFANIDITVARVEYVEYTKTEAIPYSTTYRQTIVFKEGQKKTKQAGRNGERTYTYRDRVVDGEVVETILVSEKVTKKAVNAIILVGMPAGTPLSKSPYEIKLDSKGQPVQYLEKYTGVCTAYSSEERTVGTITASGRRAQVGVVAVNPKLIPYGTELYITSADGKYVYGYAIAGDIGSGVENGSLISDLYMDTALECKYHGKRTMNVYVIKRK